MIRTILTIATMISISTSATGAFAEEHVQSSQHIERAQSMRASGTVLVSVGSVITGLAMFPTIIGLATWNDATPILVGSGVTAIVLSMPLIIAGAVMTAVGRRRLRNSSLFLSSPSPLSMSSSSLEQSFHWRL